MNVARVQRILPASFLKMVDEWKIGEGSATILGEIILRNVKLNVRSINNFQVRKV